MPSFISNGFYSDISHNYSDVSSDDEVLDLVQELDSYLDTYIPEDVSNTFIDDLLDATGNSTGDLQHVDLPQEIQQARYRPWPRYKQCKQENPRSKVTIVYPAKLILDSRLVNDEMPEWQRYINASRLSSIEHVGRLNDQTTSQLDEPSYQSQHDPQNGKGPEHPDTIAFSQQQTGDVMQRQYNTCNLPALNDSFNGPQYSIPLSSQKEQNPISQMNSTCSNTVINSTCPNTIHSQPMYSHDNPNVHQSESHTNQNNNKSQSHQTTSNNNSKNSAQSQSDMPAVYFNLDTQSVETYASVTSPKYGAVTSRSSITNNNTLGNSGDKQVIPERGRARNIRAASRSEKRVESASPHRRQNRISPVSINRNDSTSKNDKRLGQYYVKEKVPLRYLNLSCQEIVTQNQHKKRNFLNIPI
ncbi:transcription factor mef2A-like [Ruditapes philippinarum]|uniref:transcription factor mef2A-like n=1 Tax=Ruditapes philippinarum TaxID=129788 RepID=UPI00295A872A|nr:transcription factor mef2A-like [Ruditapes philippinarum]